jgi:hypothetical protein
LSASAIITAAQVVGDQGPDNDDRHANRQDEHRRAHVLDSGLDAE